MLNIKFAGDFLNSHPLLGWVVAALVILGLIITRLANTIESFQSIKAKLLIPAASRYKHKRLVKAAIKSDVESGINTVIDDIAKEIPEGWIKPLKVNWVQKENRKTFIKDGQIVMRVEPLDKEDRNFVNALYLYATSSFFPKTKNVFEDVHFESTILQFCRRIVRQSKPGYETTFNDDVLEPAIIKRDKIPEYLERLESLDQRGLFTGIFIREIHNIADLIRLSSKRKSMGSEYNDVLKHLEEFLKELLSADRVSESRWNRNGQVASYGLILVAHPQKAAQGAVNGYVNRAKERAEKNINHLYVFGSSKEASFVKEVIKAIRAQAFGYKLVEEFSLNKDYRGEKGGHGALFVLDK